MLKTAAYGLGQLYGRLSKISRATVIGLLLLAIVWALFSPARQSKNITSGEGNAAQATSSSDAGRQPRSVVVGTSGDAVLELRGKALSSIKVGSDEQGLLVEWSYPDATYLLGRRRQGDIEAYRVIKITPKP